MPEQGLDVDELCAGLEEPEGVTLMGAPSFAWRARCKPPAPITRSTQPP